MPSGVVMPCTRAVSRTFAPAATEPPAESRPPLLIAARSRARTESKVVMPRWRATSRTLAPVATAARAEAGDLPLRATHPDAFAGSGLDAELRRRGVTELHFLTLPGTETLPATAETARGLGYEVRVPEAQPQTLGTPG